MLSARTVAAILWSGTAVFSAGGVYGDDYPNKPIRILAGSPGGAADFAARLIAPGLSNNLGQQVVIDGSVGGIIDNRAQLVSKAAPDGYTLLFTSDVLWLTPFMRNNVPYDPIQGFTPITLTSISPTVLIVHPSVPARSARELIGLAKAHPGSLNYAIGGLGTSSHLAAELFKTMAGIKMVLVPYKGGAPQLTALIVGEVQLTFSTAATVMPHLTTGRVRALAVTSKEPSAVAPGLPTLAASGLPGYEMTTNYGIVGPPKMPQDLVNRLNREIVRALQQPDVRSKFLATGGSRWDIRD